MRTPEEALAEARARAAAARALAEAQPGEWHFDDPGGSTKRLAEWAVIQPEEVEIYSTRRFGAPITALKKGLVRLLRQYFNQVNAQQSRFNANVAAHIIRLEERVEALERRAQGTDEDGQTHGRTG